MTRTTGRHSRALGRQGQTKILGRELAALRLSLREITSRFQLRWEAELVRLQDRLAAAEAKPPGKAWDAFVHKSVALIRSTRLRPKQGRLKDLGRIRDLARRMAERAPGGTAKAPRP